MSLILFQPQFAALVANGTKRQTIRLARKRRIEPGNRLILGEWIGLPYRSKVRRLGEATCTKTHEVVIYNHKAVYVDGKNLSRRWRFALAAADGFANIDEMVAWFERVHGLPFRGVMIRWQLTSKGVME